MRMMVLTDHRTHAAGESIYPLVQEMAAQRPASDVWVASRSSPGNQGFFAEGDESSLMARAVDGAFEYTDSGSWFEGGVPTDVSDFDVIFLRLDREKIGGLVVSPSLFLRSLSRRFPQIVIINDPLGIIHTGSKRFLLQFQDLCPRLAVCTTIEALEDFVAESAAVIKPIHGYGGKGLMRLDQEGGWVEKNPATRDEVLGLVKEQLEEVGEVVAMEFLPDVGKGDKRVLVVDGVVLGATLRRPAEGSWLCGLSSGGSSSPAEADEREVEMARRISAVLGDEGVAIYGFDTLEDSRGQRVLSEINTLNVGGLVQAERHSGKPVIQRAAELLWGYADRRLEASAGP